MDQFDQNRRTRVHWLVGISTVLTLTLLAVSCDDQGLTSTNNTESSESPVVTAKKSATAAKVVGLPTHGSTPLPESEGASQPATDLLQAYVDQHPDTPYVAIVGNWNHAESRYEYKAVPLTFQQSTISDANGERGYYHFQVEDDGGKPLAALAGLIPATSTAQEKMSNWLTYVSPVGQSGTSSASASGYQPPMMKSFGEPGGGGGGTDNGGCSYAMCVEGPEVVVTGDAPNGDPWADGGWADENWPPDDGGVAPGNYPSTGGGGNGSTGGSSDFSFAGDITVDRTIRRNDLTDCVLRKLRSGTGNESLFNNLIGKFEGNNSEFDLKFELTEVDNNAFGALTGTIPNFVVEVDASWVTDRNDIEVASTFIHEAMHAEMRRYLKSHGEENSTLPGFPHSFTEDWNDYVAEKYGKDPQNIKPAEHEAMAKYFIGFIADGLQEFDNSQLDRKHYEALAWDGLLNTKAWDAAEQTEIGRYRNDEAIDDRPQQCNR